MTEFENGIIKPLITIGTIAFSERYVDDTIVLAKPCDLHSISKQFNSFHPQIQFTIDQFSDNDIHFLDIQILSPMVPQSTANKPTLDNISISTVILHGQERLPGYVHLFIEPTKFVVTTIFYKKNPYCQMLYVMEWLLTQTSHKTVSVFSPASTTKNPYTVDVNVDNTPNLNKIWIPLPYIGKHGIKLANSFIRKITPLLKSQCKIIINWQTTDATPSFHLKILHRNNTKAPLFMNLNAQDATQTTLETVAFPQELKNTSLKTILKYIIT